VERKTSVEAAKDFPENYFDLILLDTVHDYPNMVNDLWAWLPKMKNEGVICGHDYVRRFSGLIKAVDEVLGEDFLIEGELGGYWWVFLSSERKNRYLARITGLVGCEPERLLAFPPNLFKQEA
jgi:hypothetical protein